MALHEYMLSDAPHRPLAVLLKERRFHPGDKITGKIRVTATEPLNAYCIFVLLRGTEEASAGFHAVGGTMHEQAFSIFLHHRQYVVPPQEPPPDKPLYGFLGYMFILFLGSIGCIRAPLTQYRAWCIVCFDLFPPPT